MGAGLLQWNPSALRVQWDSSNLRAMMALSTCANCYATPVSYTVALSGLVNTSCCDDTGGTSAAYVKAVGVAEFFNDTFEVPLQAGETCAWLLQVSGNPGDYGTFNRYSDASCETFIEAIAPDRYSIWIQITGENVFRLIVWIDGDGYFGWIFDTTLAVGANCAPDAFGNGLTGCGDGAYVYLCDDSGTATLTANY